MHRHNSNALQHWFWQDAFTTVQCCSGLLFFSQQACVTVTTPMEIWSSYNCAVRQQKCSAAVFRAKWSHHCSVLLCKSGSQQACVTVITPMEIWSSYRCAVRSRLRNSLPVAYWVEDAFVTQPNATNDVLNCSHDSHRSRCEHVTAVRVHLDGA